MKGETDTKTALKQWLAKTNGRVQADEIRDDTAIIEEKIISSMDTMDLILEIENLKGSPVDPAQLKPGIFKSVNTLYKAFFSNDGGPFA